MDDDGVHTDRCETQRDELEDRIENAVAAYWDALPVGRRSAEDVQEEVTQIVAENIDALSASERESPQPQSRFAKSVRFGLFWVVIAVGLYIALFEFAGFLIVGLILLQWPIYLLLRKIMKIQPNPTSESEDAA